MLYTTKLVAIAGAATVVTSLALSRSNLYRCLLHLGEAAADLLYIYRENDEEEHEPFVPVLGQPQVNPIRTVKALLEWSPPDPCDPGPTGWMSGVERNSAYCQMYNAPLPSSVAAPKNAAPEDRRPKLLVCHDMANNYHEDRFVQGSSDEQFYKLYRWECIDTFVYFSHNLVTIPPPGWVASAHRNGVRVLGTFITEWSKGRKLCLKMFRSVSTAQKLARQLVAIAVHHGFEGWLINIENTLPASLIPNVLHFLSYLRTALHRAIPHAMLMWYDAVTTEGWLEWQNHLTVLNRPFLDHCDAVFLNYHWKEGTPAEVAAAAGSRSADVYLGTDVWGRGTYGGGQDNCGMALKASHAAGVSAALFAPGWVYEHKGRGGWRERQQLFWQGVSVAWPIKPVQTPSSPFVHLPLSSCFNTGSGAGGSWLHGVQLSSQPWFNQSLQGLLPQSPNVVPDLFSTDAQEREAGAGVKQNSLSVRLTDKWAFDGGSCLMVHGTPVGGQGLKLFDTAMPFPHGGLQVTFASATPPTPTATARAAPDGATPCSLGICLWVSKAEPSSATPLSSRSTQRYTLSYSTDSSLIIISTTDAPTQPSSGDVIHLKAEAARVIKVPDPGNRNGTSPPASPGPGTDSGAWEMIGGAPPRRASANQRPDWKLWTCHVSSDSLAKDMLIRGVGVVCVGDKGQQMAYVEALLGHISMSLPTASPPSPPSGSSQISISNLVCQAGSTLSCDLTWQPEFNTHGIQQHHSYHVWAFRVSDATHLDENNLPTLDLSGLESFWLGQSTIARWYVSEFPVAATASAIVGSAAAAAAAAPSTSSACSAALVFVVQPVCASDSMLHTDLDQCIIRGMLRL